MALKCLRFQKSNLSHEKFGAQPSGSSLPLPDSSTRLGVATGTSLGRELRKELNEGEGVDAGAEQRQGLVDERGAGAPDLQRRGDAEGGTGQAHPRDGHRIGLHNLGRNCLVATDRLTVIHKPNDQEQPRVHEPLQHEHVELILQMPVRDAVEHGTVVLRGVACALDPLHIFGGVVHEFGPKEHPNDLGIPGPHDRREENELDTFIYGRAVPPLPRPGSSPC